MPLSFGEITTPKGRRCLLIDSEGLCDLADGQAMQARLVPGQPHHFGLVCSRAAKTTEFSPELRANDVASEGEPASASVLDARFLCVHRGKHFGTAT